MFRGDDGAHAGATNDIDRGTALVKRAQRADVSEAACSTATQGQADGVTGQESGEPLKIAAIGESNVVVHRDMSVAKPARGAAWALAIVRLNQDEPFLRLAGVLGAVHKAGFNLRQGRIVSSEPYGQDLVGLMNAALRPLAVGPVGFEQNEIVDAFLRTQPGGKTGVYEDRAGGG